MKAKDMPGVTVEQVLRLRDSAIRLEHQRDQLREALSVMLEDYADACDQWDDESQEFGRKVIEQARTALKDTEDNE